MPKSLEELREREQLFNSSKLVDYGGVKVECGVANQKLENEPEMKRCPDCGTTKTLNYYHVDNKSKDGHVKFCKECTATKRQKQTEEHAKDLFYKEVIPYTKTQKAIFTVSDIWSKLGNSKTIGYNLLKTMADLELLKVTKKGVTNYYEILNGSKSEGQYEDLADEFEDIEPKIEVEGSVEISNVDFTKPNVPKIVVKKPKGLDAIGIKTDGTPLNEPITDTEVKQIEDIGVKVNEEIVNSTIKERDNMVETETKGTEYHLPRHTILKTIENIYDEAQEITITPETHELHIKMKV